MLVSVDIEQGTVTLYDKTIVVVPLKNLRKLQTLLGGRTVHYISEVTLVSGEDILDMVSQYADDPSIPDVVVPSRPVVAAEDRCWLYAKGSGYLNIPLPNPDLKGPPLCFRFEGPEDFKPLSRLGRDIFEKMPILQELLDKGRLGLVTTKEMNRIKKDVAKHKADMDDKMSRNSDGSSLIVDTREGRMKPREMGDEFEDVDASAPDDEFLTEAQKMVIGGYGRDEHEAGEENAGEIDPSEMETE